MYVVDSKVGKVSVIDGTTSMVTATISVGGDPQSIAVDPIDQTVYVADYLADTVSMIDGITDTVTATLPVGSSPDAVAVDPTTQPRMWPTNPTAHCR